MGIEIADLQGLTQELDELEDRIESTNAEREAGLSKMDRIFKEPASKKKQGSELQLELESLRSELSSLRNVPALDAVAMSRLSSASNIAPQLDSSGLLAGLSSFPSFFWAAYSWHH